MSNKIKLVKLITKAKNEYDKYDLKTGYKTLEEAYKLDKTNPTILRGFGCFKQAEENYDEAMEVKKKKKYERLQNPTRAMKKRELQRMIEEEEDWDR